MPQKRIIFGKKLSPGQTDSQVVASSHKLNMRRDLRWVAKRTRKSPRKYTQVAIKPISRQTYAVFHWLIIGKWTSLNLRWLGLGGQTVKNLRRPACKFDLDQSERKSSQVNASACKAWPNGVASRCKLRTWVYWRLRLARALSRKFSNALFRELERYYGIKFLKTEEIYLNQSLRKKFVDFYLRLFQTGMTMLK